MDELFSAYFDLSTPAQSVPEQAGPILRRILALQPELQPELRRKLLSHLLVTLSTLSDSRSDSPAEIQFLSTLLSLVKFLGRSAAGSEALAREDGLRILLQHGGLARTNQLAPLERNDDDSESNDHPAVEAGVDPLASYESEALRCLCNTLTLHRGSRDVFAVVLSENTKWIGGIVRLLELQGAGFLAGRLLFLLTSKMSELVIRLGDEGVVVKSIAAYSRRYISALQSSNGALLTSGPAPTSADILQEHLKTAYNLMLQYGRHNPPPPDVPVPSLAVNDSLSPPTPSSNPTSPSPSSSAVRSPTPDSARSSPMEVNGRSAETGPAADEPAGETIGLGLGENWSSASTSKPKRRFWESKSSAEKKSVESTGKKSSEIPSRKTMETTASPRSKSPGLFGRLIGGGSSKSTTPPVPQLPAFVSDPSADGPLEGTLTLLAAQKFLPLFSNLVALAVLLPLGTDAKSPSRLLRHAADTLLNFPITLEELDGYATSWLQPVTGATIVYPSLAPLPSRLLDLLTRACDAYFPTDAPPGAAGNGPPHPDEVLTGGAGESAKAEEVLGPIVLLLRKLSLLAEPAGGLKDIVLPYNIDRANPLEQRTDLIGHLLRLLSSIFLPNTAHGVGEFLFNLCNRDPVLFCTEIGYGNASGFLQNIGQLIPPPQMPTTRMDRQHASSSSAGTTSTSPRFTEVRSNGSDRVGSPKPAGRLVNPITGAYEQPSSSPAIEMTSEEKLLEAERLYTLFDRMAKTGVMEVENPVNKARSEGKFVETSDEAEEELRRLKEQEEKDEKEAEEEMRRWKERGKQGNK